MTRVLIVDDDPLDLQSITEAVREAGYEPLPVTGGNAALSRLRADPAIGALLIDMVMPDLDGPGVLDAMAREALATPVILMAGSTSPGLVATALRRGAVDYLIKPISSGRLAMALAGATRVGALEDTIRLMRHERLARVTAADLVGDAEPMRRAASLLAKAAKASHPILIEGERGTGRTLASRILHQASDRAGRPFVTVDVATLASAGMEAALFGEWSEGRLRPGLLHSAQGGTLVIDNIGELTAGAQRRLVRLVEAGEIEPVGAGRTQRLDARLVGVTDRRLVNLARAGHFREDLFFRLNVMPVYLPPLRDRAGDIAGLVRLFTVRHAAEAGRRVSGVTEAALDLLQRHAWPGNVAELEAACCRAVLLDAEGELGPDDFPGILAAVQGRAAAIAATAAATPASAPIHIDALNRPMRTEEHDAAAAGRFIDDKGALKPLDRVERELIAFALDYHRGRMSRVARALGIGRSTLYRKLKEYGLADGMETDAA